jgi:hypothetical protein
MPEVSPPRRPSGERNRAATASRPPNARNSAGCVSTEPGQLQPEPASPHPGDFWSRQTEWQRARRSTAPERRAGARGALLMGASHLGIARLLGAVAAGEAVFGSGGTEQVRGLLSAASTVPPMLRRSDCITRARGQLWTIRLK